MNSESRKIAIVGAGPGGARLAALLADRGKEVVLFDHRAPWEKPCGGGLTPRTRTLIPEISRMGLDEIEHKRVTLLFPSGRRVKLSLTWPLYTTSRARLGKGLLDQALRAGAEFRPEKVRGISITEEAAVVQTGSGEIEADLVVGADGVNSLVRQTVIGRIPRPDLCLAYIALVPIKANLPIIMKFFARAEGYAWIFPRAHEISVGIAMENADLTHAGLKQHLVEFVTEEFRRAGLDSPDGMEPRGWYLPALRPESFAKSASAGERWALIGDASGACDPLTGEGIYYAIETAQSLGQALCSGYFDYVKTYNNSWNFMASNSLARASGWRGRFYRSRNLNLLGYCIDHSPSIRNLTRDLLAGVQEYNSLKQRIMSRWPKYTSETVYNTLRFKSGERG